MLLRAIRLPLDSEDNPVWMRDLLCDSSLSLAAAELLPLPGLRRLNAFFREDAMFCCFSHGGFRGQRPQLL